MEQEYTISNGMKVIFAILSIAMFIFSLFIFLIPRNPNVSPAVVLIPLLLILGAILIFVNMLRRKIVISDEGISYTGLFTTKRLASDEIKGCRIGQKTIYIEAVSSANSSITIRTYNDFVDSDQIAGWLKDKFKDLDVIDLRNEKEKLLSNSDLGFSESDKMESLKKMKIVYISYNIIGAILCFSMIPFQNEFSSVVLISYPLLGILVIIFSKGLIKFVSNSKRSIYGFIMLGFILPSFMMFVKSMGGYEISNYQNLWLPFTIISLAIFITVFFIGLNKAIGFTTGQVVIMLIAALLFAYGSVIQVNCVFDKSTPQLVNSTITEKSKEYSKGEHYYLKLSSWDLNPQPKNIEVSKHTYDNYNVGGKIDVDVKPGTLNISWYQLH